jgi:hypothetical protein
MSQLEQVAAGALIRARPWDLTGIGLAAPMVIWGFLGWFGTVGDSAGGQPGFFSGTGAAGIGLVLAAATIALNQSLAGRPHEPTSPPVAAMLAGAAALLILGGMIAKPDSTTIQAGSVAGLLTALSQAGALTIGWLRGSEKSLKAANVRAAQAQQAAADQAAQYGTGSYGTGQYGPAYQPNRSYPAPPAPRYPAAQYPPGGPGQYGQHPGGPGWSSYPPTQQYPPAQQYPAVQQYPAGPGQYAGQGSGWPQATGQYPYPPSQSGPEPQQYPDPYGKNGSPPPSR